jgi:hypothetical protein
MGEKSNVSNEINVLFLPSVAMSFSKSEGNDA